MKRLALATCLLACEPEAPPPDREPQACATSDECEPPRECLGGLCLKPCDGQCMCCETLFCCEDHP